MNKIVLQRKLSPPSSDNLLTRPELVDKLTHYSKSPLTVIHAPAGYGKTSLVCNWSHYASHPVYWLSLDEQNNLPSSFWLYLCACLKRIDHELDNEAEKMLASHFINDYHLITDLVLTSLEKLSRKWNCPTRVVVILDDFQFIDHPQILSSFNRFLDYLPHWLQFIITTRTSPALMLANRCSKSKAHIMQANELIINAKQIADFLDLKFNMSLSDKQLEKLFNKTEGWAAAIQLMGLVLKSGRPFEQCLKANDSLLDDFLFEEVFSQLDTNVKNFLLDISILDYFNLELCELTNSQRDNAAILENLINQNLFIIKIDAQLSDRQSQKFRLHSLFRQWLINNNKSSLEQINHIKSIALTWFMNNEQFNDALELSLTLSRWQDCSEIMANLYPSMVQITHFNYLDNILKRIPSEVISALPHLSLMAALLHFNRYQYDKVEEYTRYIDVFFDKKSNSTQYIGKPIPEGDKTSLIMGSMILQAQVARFSGQPEKAIVLNNTAESLFYEKNTALNCWIILGKGVDCFFSDKINDAIRHNQHALNLAKKEEDGLCIISALCWLLHSLYHNGQIHIAIRLGEENINWLMHRNLLSLPNLSSIYAAMSTLYLENNQLDSAWDNYSRLLTTINDFTDPREVIYNKFHTHVHLLSSLERYEEAHSCLVELEKYEDQSENDLKKNLSILLESPILKALLESKMGNNFPLIQLTSNRAANESAGSPSSYFRSMFEHMIYASSYMILTSGSIEGDDDTKSFFEIEGESSLHGNRFRQISCHLIPARIFYSLGEEQKALQHFNKALDIASQSQFTNLIIEDGKTTLPLINLALKHEIHTAYCKSLCASLESRRQYISKTMQINEIEEPKTSLNSLQKLNQSLIESLSSRELEVLQKVNQGERNQQIAESLSLSVSTIKRHLQNIYQKLQVNSRTEAIAILNK